MLPSTDALVREALALCVQIASKSPVAVVGIKHHLNFARDNSVQAANEHLQLWNMVALQSEDLMASFKASMTKTTPIYSNL